MGAGAKVHLTFEAILQASIALRLIDCGIEVARAYLIGAHVAYKGQGGPATWGSGDLPKPDPVTFRAPAPEFKEGQTWLVCSAYLRQKALFDDGFVVFSSADPDFHPIDKDGSSKLSNVLREAPSTAALS